jgi:hypothetical protein
LQLAQIAALLEVQLAPVAAFPFEQVQTLAVVVVFVTDVVLVVMPAAAAAAASHPHSSVQPTSIWARLLKVSWQQLSHATNSPAEFSTVLAPSDEYEDVTHFGPAL